jgi:hypothetical protein
MSRELFDLDQIVQLQEVQKARLRAEGRGIRAEVQELITRLTSGGVGTEDTTDSFLVQSKVLWDKGWGRELGFGKLDAYRRSLEQEGLSTTPERPPDMPDHLNRLVLWDRRPLFVREDAGKGTMLERVSLVKACRLLGVSCSGDDGTLIQHEATPEITVPVRWVWCQDGRRNRNRKPVDCRQSFVRPEVGAEALTGLFLYAQEPAVIGGEGDAWHTMDLPGSVHRDDPSYCACLGLWSDGPRLYWDWGDEADPKYGSASRWE